MPPHGSAARGWHDAAVRGCRQISTAASASRSEAIEAKRVYAKALHLNWEVSCPACVALPPFPADTHIALVGQTASPENVLRGAPIFTASIRLSIASTVRRAWMAPTAAVFPV